MNGTPRGHGTQRAQGTPFRGDGLNGRNGPKVSEPPPAPCDFGVIPSGNDVGAGPQDQMEVIGKDTEPEQVDAELGGQPAEVAFDPEFAVIVIFAGDRVVADQEAASDDTVHDMQDRDFVVGENFRPSEPRHGRGLAAEQVYRNDLFGY